MEEQNTNSATTSSPEKRRSVPARIGKALLYLLLGFVLFLFLVIGFTETDYFHSIARDFLVETLESSLNADVSIGEINGNIVSGWRIDSVRVNDEHGDILFVKSIVVRYDILRIPYKVIPIKEVTLAEPRIRITRAEGRDWNTSTLFKKKERQDRERDSTSTPFSWTIDAENIRILDGEFIRFDSSDAGPYPGDRLDPEHIHITGLNVFLNGKFAPHEKTLSIYQFRFNNNLGEFRITNISGDVVISDKGTILDKLSVQTPRSDFMVDVAADSLNVLEGMGADVLYDTRFKLDFSSNAFDVRDLQYFIPTLAFLGSTYELKIRTEGTLNDLTIRELSLAAERTELAFQGTIKDISNGGELFIDVEATEAQIHGGDLPLILPGLDLPDYSTLGLVQFSLLEYQGRPREFDAAIDLECDAGHLSTVASMDMTDELTEYNAFFETQHLDLSKVLNNAQLSTSLNASGNISGTGFVPGSMNTTLEMKVDSSRYQRYTISHMDFFTALGPSLLRTNVTVASEQGDILLRGRMKFEEDSVTMFEMQTLVEGLDLAAILNDEGMKSDLNFNLTAQGNSIDVQYASGDLSLAIEPSVFQGIDIREDTLRLSLQQENRGERKLSLMSQYADITLFGQFDIPRFAQYAGMQADSIIQDLERFALGKSSSDSLTAEPELASETRIVNYDSSDFMDAVYYIELRNPERIARYFDDATFILRGSYRGKIKGGMRGMDIDGAMRISDLYYIDSLSTYKLAGATLSYDLEGMQLRSPLSHVKGSIDLRVADAAINTLRLSRVGFGLDYENEVPHFTLRGTMDTTMTLGLKGDLRYQDSLVRVSFDSLAVDYAGLAWENTSPVQVYFDTSQIGIEQLRLKHGQTFLNLEGRRRYTGSNEFILSVDSLPVMDVEYLLTGNEFALGGQSFTGRVFFEANILGTDADPKIAAEIYIDSLGYEGYDIGEMYFEGRYNENLVELYSELEYILPDQSTQQVFFLSGSIPASVSFTEGAKQREDKEANLRVQMKDFPLPLVERFVSTFSDLKGTANADITVVGTAEAPDFDGFLSVDEGRAKLQFNNMAYDFGLKVEPESDRLTIKEFWMQNLPQDWRGGRLSGSGEVGIEDFQVSTLNIDLQGALKVLKPESRSTFKLMYGDLVVSTGSGSLNIGGAVRRPRITGRLDVVNGDLTYPPAQQRGGVSSYSDITYVVVDDTTKSKRSSLSGQGIRSARARFGGASSQKRRTVEQEASGGSTQMSYDITLSAESRIRFVMPISTLTSEELNAQLQFDALRISNFGGENKFIGEVRLVGNSYYLFFGKRFEASGSLQFVGTPDNPALNLRAVYSDYYTNESKNIYNRQVFVIMDIGGTKNKPEIAYDIRYDSESGPAVATGGNIESDALSFVLLGQFSDELTAGDETRLAEQAGSLGSAVASSMFNAAFSSLYRDLGIIRRIEVEDLGENPRLKVSSEFLGTLVTYDGQLNNLDTYEVSAEIPVGSFVGLERLMLEFTRRKIDNAVETGSFQPNEDTYEAKLLYRIPF
ncbi:MAG: hypothetical protein CL946_10120 [Ectothiorhodospiraceae bacterium]|nr:hypothetical protein [Ectothiorhodospiraceae bacterium]